MMAHDSVWIFLAFMLSESAACKCIPHMQEQGAVRCPKDIAARMQQFKHMLPRLPLPPASHKE